MNTYDRLGNRLFGFLRTAAVLTAVVALVVLFAAGPAAAWPWAKASLLCAAPVASPAIATWMARYLRQRRAARHPRA